MIASPARADDTDVVVIGAGAAGIAAGRRLQELGKRFVIIEASDRVGGRVHTDTSLGDPFDAGAAYIHFSGHNPWAEIAREVGVDAAGGYRLWRGSRAFRNGIPLTDDEARERWQAASKVSDAFADVSERWDESFAAAVEDESRAVIDVARTRALLATGEEPQFVSVADFERLDGGSDLVVREGYGTLVSRYAEGLPVRFGVRAEEIDWSGAGVRIVTNQGTIRARGVIITVSVGVLQSGRMKFTPRLPRETLDAIGGLRMGALSKLALRLEGDRFGFEPHAFLQEVADPAKITSFEMWPFERNLVLAVFGGDYARDLGRRGEAAATEEMLDRLVKMAGGNVRKAFKGSKLWAWPENPYSLGSYSVALPGRMRAREALAKPVGDKLWFAGEASAGAGSMTAGGASLAAREAVRQLAAKLTTGSIRR
jgi:monoamine oxidase